MHQRLTRTLTFLLLLTTCAFSAAQVFPSSSSANLLGTDATFLPVEDAYQLEVSLNAGQLTLDWQIAPGYYLYQHRFQLFDSNQQPIELKPVFPAGKQIYDEYYERELTVYYEQITFDLPLDPAAYQTLFVESQGCADAGLCYPPRTQKISIDPDTGAIAVTESQAPAPAAQQPATTKPSTSLYPILLFALLGGIILNLMPCVFPVLSIKALSLTSHQLSSHGRHLHGLAYTLGVVLSFMAIALLLIVLRRTGEAVGWGFQLQSPVFVGLLAYLFILMGLGFSGLLTLGTGLMNVGHSTTRGHSLRSSFMTGLLATVVASPCTAPFMGTALGFALVQPVWTALSVFLFLGLGMALPLLLLSCWPWLGTRLPRPGPWMETFREVLAFPLYLSAAWLLWVLGRQAGSDTVIAMVTGIILILFALWLIKLRKTPFTRLVAVTAVIIALIIPWQTYRGSGVQLTHWEPYTETRQQQLLDRGDAVFVNLTADWCITCLANEKMALSSSRITSAFTEQQITYLKGDWTNYNPEITRLLNLHQRSGVPLYLFYRKGHRQPVILPQLLTENIVISAISPQLAPK
ncbi:protein-disulfide reductase DsbD family protein [Porticoccus sp.]|uniref:protein-disulfide reductase DsbD family protein n=1 Tax=Porticoccus sp. TaxID=2024853 RepID=UPI003F69D2AF